MDNNPFQNKKFKDLQSQWYSKLKQDGFEDIEDIKSDHEFLKQWHSLYFQGKYTAKSFTARQDYFVMAGKFLADYRFKSKQERLIWKLHVDGLSLREIARALTAKKIRTNKDKVHKVVARLRKLMRQTLGQLEDKTSARSKAYSKKGPDKATPSRKRR